MGENAKLVFVHSPSHHEDLVNGLWNFFNTKYRVDFDILFAGRSLRAHQLVMDIFLPPENLDRNRIMTCRRSNLDSLFEFMYKGQVAVPQGELDNLYWTAKKLGFNQLTNAVDAIRSETTDRLRSNSRKAGAPNKMFKRGVEASPKSQTTELNPEGKDLQEWHGLMDVLRANCNSPETLEVDCDVGEASREIGQTPSTNCKKSTIGSATSRSEVSRLYRQSLPLVKCKFCCYETRDRRYYGRHYNKHHPDEELPTCPKCKTPFFDWDGLANHMAKMHSILDYPREPPEENNKTLQLEKLTTASATPSSASTASVTSTQSRPATFKMCRKGSRLSNAAAEAAKQFRLRQPLVKCKHCDYETRDRRYYGNHYSRCHPEVEIPRCPQCRSPFFSFENLASHMAKVHFIVGFPRLQTAAEISSKEISGVDEETLVSGRVSTTSATKPSSEEKSEAAITPAEARTLARSRAAAKRYRSQLTRKQCEHCHFSTVSKECYGRHLRQHHPEVTVPVCDLCGQSFFSESQLADHKARPNLIVHTDRHRKRVAQLRAARRTREDGRSGFKARKLASKERLRCSTECDFCDHVIGDKANYVDHLVARHPEETAFKCATCDWAFLDAESLAAHRIEHGGKCIFHHRCVHCPFKTEFATSLQRHLQTQHNIGSQAKVTQRNHKCTLCKFAGELPSHLRRHMETTHAIVKQFKCHMCSYAASRSISLKKHIDKMHLKLKPWICEICAHPSSSKHNMDRHRLTHTGEKPFPCKYCDQAFADRNILKTHTRAKHTHEKPYVCHICSWAFVALTHLKRHLKVHEPR